MSWDHLRRHSRAKAHVQYWAGECLQVMSHPAVEPEQGPSSQCWQITLSPVKYSLLPDTVEAGELLHRKGPQLQGREEMVTAMDIGKDRKE